MGGEIRKCMSTCCHGCSRRAWERGFAAGVEAAARAIETSVFAEDHLRGHFARKIRKLAARPTTLEET